MPLAVVLLIRVLIQATVQVGIFIGLDKALAPLTDMAKKQVAETFGMTEEEAKDTIANEIIDAFAMIGIIAVSIKTKLPTIVAEKLGFTSKGYIKRQISSKLPAGTPGSVAKSIPASGAVKVLTTAEATVAIETATRSFPGFSEMYKLLIGTLGVIFMGFMAVGNWIDFGNWNSGAYQTTFQKILAFVTGGLLRPDEDYRKSKTASDDVFGKVYNAYKLAGVVGINDPFKFQSVTFSRESLMDVVDQVGATLLISKGSASTKEVLAATQLFMIYGAGAGDSLPAVSASNVTSPVLSSVSESPVARVFSGIVSQGVLGPSLVFTPRPDDLIESVRELEEAASNNISAYLNTLLGKVVYEVKIVPSYISKDGFKQTGQTQRVRSGTYENGTAKYKTITNKFAVVILYAVTDKGSRAKLTTIVLGPTDSAKLLIGSEQLRVLEAKLPALVTTNNFAEIAGIETPEDTATVGTTPPAETSVSAPDTAVSGEPAQVGVPISPVATTAGAGATTLSGWYQAQGLALPSVSVRASLYEALGLGVSSFFTGTAEQNTRLLSALKNLWANGSEDNRITNKKVLGGGLPLSSLEQFNQTGASSKSTAPTNTSTKTTTTTKAPDQSKPVTVTRSYTTTSGEKVTKYSNGTEKRVKAKK